MNHLARRLVRRVVPCSLALAALTVPSTASAATNDAPPPAARWSTAGRWIVDEAGRVVITHGVNEVEKNAPFAPDAIGFDEDDAAFLAAQGFTSVRLGVIWAGVEPAPGVFDEAYLDRIERTVRLLDRYGISSLLDSHQDMLHEKFQGNGWPGWAILDRGAPNIIKAGFPGNYFLNVGVKNAFDSFYDNSRAADGIGLADHFAAMWAHVATRFRNVPGVMGYDLINEPFPGTNYLGCLSPAFGCPIQDARLSAVQQKAANAIRGVDQRTTVWYEPQQLFNISIPTNVRVRATNVGLSFHDYCTSQATMHNYVGCAGPDATVFANAEKHSGATGAGLLLTEFGAITSQDVLRAQTDLAARNRIGWQYWAYTGGDPTTAGPGREQAVVFDPSKPPTGDNVDWAKLDAIAVVHPDRVAGTPTSYGYDRDARRFHLEWTAAGPTSAPTASLETTVVVPERLRAKGYTVTATGATVVSAPDERVVRLRLAPGSTRASMTLQVR